MDNLPCTLPYKRQSDGDLKADRTSLYLLWNWLYKMKFRLLREV